MSETRSATIFNPLQHPILFAEPERAPGDSAWREHIPFAMLLMELLRPRVFVELGTYAGASYCAFCQASQILKVAVRCYAVDTWQGDAHAGNYAETVLEGLRKHHDARYSGFSQLLQMTFDKALDQFEDGTVDLLHIDGLHTYEAVKHDFETWLPKMSERGVILFHDTAVTDKDFGVKRLWEEVQQDRLHFEFKHGHGLGILAVGDTLPEPFVEFIEMANEHTEEIRFFFSAYGRKMSLMGEVETTQHQSDIFKQSLLDIYDSQSFKLAVKAHSLVHPFKKK